MHISVSTLVTALLAVTACEGVKVDPKVLNNAAAGQNATAAVSAGASVGQGGQNGQQAGAKQGVSQVGGGEKTGAAALAKTGAAQVGSANTLAQLPGSGAVQGASLKALPGLATGAAAAASPASLQALPGLGGAAAVGASVRCLSATLERGVSSGRKWNTNMSPVPCRNSPHNFGRGRSGASRGHRRIQCRNRRLHNH